MKYFTCVYVIYILHLISQKRGQNKTTHVGTLAKSVGSRGRDSTVQVCLIRHNRGILHVAIICMHELLPALRKSKQYHLREQIELYIAGAISLYSIKTQEIFLFRRLIMISLCHTWKGLKCM